MLSITVCRSVCLSVCHSIVKHAGLSVCQSIIKHAGLSVCQSIVKHDGLSVCQSIVKHAGLSVCQSIVKHDGPSVHQFVSQLLSMMICQSVNLSVNHHKIVENQSTRIFRWLMTYTYDSHNVHLCILVHVYLNEAKVILFHSFSAKDQPFFGE